MLYRIECLAVQLSNRSVFHGCISICLSLSHSLQNQSDVELKCNKDKRILPIERTNAWYSCWLLVAACIWSNTQTIFADQFTNRLISLRVNFTPKAFSQANRQHDTHTRTRTRMRSAWPVVCPRAVPAERLLFTVAVSERHSGAKRSEYGSFCRRRGEGGSHCRVITKSTTGPLINVTSIANPQDKDAT